MKRILVILYLLLSMSPKLLAQTAITPKDLSWPKIESELEANSTYSLDELINCPSVRPISNEADADFYWEMVSQTKLPLVQLVGFEFLKTRNFNSAVEAAVYLSLSSDFPLSLGIHVLESFSDKAYSSRFITSLELFAQMHPGVPQRWSFLIGVQSIDLLERWYESHPNPEINVTYRAIILDQILAQAGPKYQPSAAMENDLEALRLIPGRPRAIYVLHTNNNEKGLAEAITEVLQDSSLPETVRVVVAMQKKDYILQNIKWIDLPLSSQVRHVLAGPETKP